MLFWPVNFLMAQFCIVANDYIENTNEAVAKMVNASPDGFGSYPFGEYEGLQAAPDTACFIEESTN